MHPEEKLTLCCEYNYSHGGYCGYSPAKIYTLPGAGGFSAIRCGLHAPGTPTAPDFDPVTRPVHYNSHPSGVECITITEHMTFCIGNAIKYLWRAGHKNGLEDLRKARWYVDREIARLEALAVSERGN